MTLPPPPALDARHALFLDFDGTLAPLQDDADTVHLSETRLALLGALARLRGGALAVISGRDVRDLAKRVPEDVLRVGNHGLYRMPPDAASAPDLDPLPVTLRDGLQDIAERFPGAFLEVKGPVGTVHSRAVPQAGLQIADAVRNLTATVPGYHAKVGHDVCEAIPEGANKGAALADCMTREPFLGRVPVMVGDDTTDEDGFLAAQRLGGFGVKVGRGETSARKRLPDVDSVWAWLEERA